MKLDKLTAKIKPHEIQWRVQSKGNGKTTVVPYLTNRCVMERFDEQFGATESVNVDGNWVTKYDGADETNIEATKGGFSDSMKRAAVQWGLGRDLYDYPMIQLEGEHKYIPRQFEQELSGISEQVSSGKLNKSYVLLNGNSKQSTPSNSEPNKPQKVVVKDGSKEFMAIVDWIINGKANAKGEIVHGTIEKAKQHYSISEAVENSLKEKIQALKEIA